MPLGDVRLRQLSDGHSDSGKNVHAVIFRVPEPPLAGQEVLQLGESPGELASEFVLGGPFAMAPDGLVGDRADVDATAGESQADDLGVGLPVAGARPDYRDGRLPQSAQFLGESAEVFISLQRRPPQPGDAPV